MIDHVTIRVSDLASSARFYGQALELLDFADDVHVNELGSEWNDFSLTTATPDRPVTRRLHIGFAARSREQVDRWFEELTGAGYESDGSPGPRPEYGPEYYGAFVRDPDGNNVEAVRREEFDSPE